MTSPIKNREEKMLASHWSIILTCYEIGNISKFIAWYSHSFLAEHIYGYFEQNQLVQIVVEDGHVHFF